MYEICRERVFSASHQLREYQGRCERLHGHNWRVRVHVMSPVLNSGGMVIDFHELDAMMAKALAPLEHQHLNDISPFDVQNPSAENIARMVYESVAAELAGSNVRIRCCDIWENDLSRARYSENL